MFIDLHDSCHVTAAITVVWSREDSYKALIMKPVVALHDKLVGTDDEVKAVFTIEFLRNVVAKSVACTTWRDAPAEAVVGVAPHEVANRSLVWHFAEMALNQHLKSTYIPSCY